MKWIAGSSTHGVWQGWYETEKQKKFAELISPGDVVFDLGGHAGFYTLLASRLFGTAGHVYSFEPWLPNCAAIRRHVEINALSNVTLVEAAVADYEGSSQFRQGDSAETGALSSDGGNVSVRVIALDWFIQTLPEAHRRPAVLKVDVEGAELRALQGTENLLRRVHPSLLVATHSAELFDQCRRPLESTGYRAESLAVPGSDGLGEQIAEAASQAVAPKVPDGGCSV